ncbi:hypothetical protein [Streptomyces olivochromogenes]|uniref:hypothetical protein n=1 Tax=Streptomyces olivochromogenes TaxID=1963 RepID=UPI0036A68C92
MGSPNVIWEQGTVLTQESAQNHFDLLHADQEVRLRELQHALSVEYATGPTDEIASAVGLEFSGRFDRAVRDRETGLSVAQYTSRLVFGEAPSPEGQRIGLIAATIATHPAAGAAASTEDTVTRALVQGDRGWINAVEYALDASGDLVVVNGLWDAFRGCLGSSCGGTCLGALGSCLPLGALPAVVACLAATCGLCAAKCAACVACDCGWLCSVITGCCHT